ncbi:hypothetical protein BKA82DRAFT_17808 [Pisolithus tinctorius]|uniref:Uncharacterized protein n=1 Tax=Pisolithus tinctorius Marx 270 TaxID=870435 RepID=A0A0C3PZ02_PISTI|nr:hypothetical protein BKA82DRAFT_17808 [Pisolithus tinctorius]KIO14991.1 hypothetical protein M404DRAFT_17808 [Pisolithus tinctorius Marx 270]
MSICWSRTPYNQDLLPDLTWATSEELQVKVQEEAQLAEEAWLEAERQEQAWLKEERARAEAEAQRVEATCKAEEAWKVAESQWADVLVLEGAGDKEEDVGEGPSMKKTSEETRTSPVTGDQMEHLIKAVEHVADNMVSLAVAQQEALRNFYQFTQSYKMYIEEHFKFLVPDMPSDWDTTNEEDRDVEGLDEELEGLRREEEESWSWSESGDQTGAGSAGSQA